MESKLSDREIVAMHALQGLLARPTPQGTPIAPPSQAATARTALAYADELLKQTRPEASGTVATA